MNAALAAVVEALEAERLAPVPDASRTAAVDVDDLALVLEHARATCTTDPPVRRGMPGEVAAACQRLDLAVRCRAVRDGNR